MISYEGRKTRLRPLRRDDMASSLRWRNDPEVREQVFGYRFPVTEQMEAKWYDSVLEDQSRSRVVFAIEVLDGDALIGFVQLLQIDWISRRCSFGITIGERRYQGQGLAADCMHLLFRYAFECLNLRKISLEVAVYNRAALNLYRKFGFTEEGVLKEHVFLEGVYHDVVVMRLLASEYATRVTNA